MRAKTIHCDPCNFEKEFNAFMEELEKDRVSYRDTYGKDRWRNTIVSVTQIIAHDVYEHKDARGYTEKLCIYQILYNLE